MREPTVEEKFDAEAQRLANAIGKALNEALVDETILSGPAIAAVIAYAGVMCSQQLKQDNQITALIDQSINQAYLLLRSAYCCQYADVPIESPDPPDSPGAVSE